MPAVPRGLTALLDRASRYGRQSGLLAEFATLLPMTLAPGTKFGTYEVLAAIGSGGMGEVYRAHDSELRRDVALKVLPQVFASDPERLARFQREAQVLASLNAIHGLEEADGLKATAIDNCCGVFAC